MKLKRINRSEKFRYNTNGQRFRGDRPTVRDDPTTSRRTDYRTECKI